MESPFAPFSGGDFLPPATTSGGMADDSSPPCSRCGFGGCDLRVAGCGCLLHTRCCPIFNQSALKQCPACRSATTGLFLFPMNFLEVDEAKKEAAMAAKSNKRSRKRKSSFAGADDEVSPGKVAKKSIEQDVKSGTEVSSQQRRTGRWTSEEVAFCDKLVEKFKTGELPIPDGVKMNEFLGSMLLSKQSRLTKKMKNAKLSSQTFMRKVGFISNLDEARFFSQLETSFFAAIQCPVERAEIKFHMQKEWREMFSNLCIKMGQPLDADSYLTSVEEMDRRSALKKDAARLARRKLMMGVALSQDSMNLQEGVFIEQTEADWMAAQSMAATSGLALGSNGETTDDDALLALLGDSFLADGDQAPDMSEVNGKSSILHAAPFLAKVVSYMQRHNVPFEHIDAWVPSFVAGDSSTVDGEQPCRLRFAGSATTEVQIPSVNGPPEDLSAEERFNLQSFGDYSQKFSFDVGCGLPGRVYQSGVPTWEQSVHNAPAHHFERCGGAQQWGIKTVVGIPVPSPNVGRIVCVLYSRHDRAKDPEVVSKLRDEFTKLMPSPKWKLVVDVSPAPPTTMIGTEQATTTVTSAAQTTTGTGAGYDAMGPSKDSKEARIDEIVAILGEHMPSDPASPLAEHIPSFMLLRLMLLRASRKEEEEEVVDTILGSYSSYKISGRATSDIAVMLARDFTFLTQSSDFHDAAPSSISFFKAPPADDFLYKNSPALTPINPPDGGGSLADMASIVSN